MSTKVNTKKKETSNNNNDVNNKKPSTNKVVTEKKVIKKIATKVDEKKVTPKTSATVTKDKKSTPTNSNTTNKKDNKVQEPSTAKNTNKKKEVTKVQPKNENKKRKNVEEDEDSDDENYYGIEYSDESNSEDEYEDDSDDVSENNKDSVSEEDEDDFDEINVQFDISKLEEIDYHSVKNMLMKLVPWTSETKFNAGDITDLMLEQCKKLNFGRAVRVEHNEDPYGFASVLNYNTYKSNGAIQGFVEYVEQKAKQTETQFVDSKLYPKYQQFSAVLSEVIKSSKKNQLGLFFSERFLNIPHQLAHPIHQYIHWDLELLVENKNNEFKFGNYLFLTTYCVVSGETTDEIIDEKEAGKLKQQREQPKKLQKINNNEKKETFDTASLKEGEEYYMKPEDEYLRKFASAWSTFHIPYEYGNGARWTLDGNMNRKGLIMIVPQSNIQKFLETIKEKLQ